MQHNLRTKTSLVDCREILGTYCRRWKTLDPAEKGDKVLYHVSVVQLITIVNGMYGFLSRNAIKFFTLGSVSRGIPEREWDIPFKGFYARTFTFCPQANIVAAVNVAWT